MIPGEPSARAADGGLTRLLVVDDHAAVRAGLIALLEDEGRLALLPPAAGAGEALELARAQRPDVALLDVSLADGDGLHLCLALKQLSDAPRVVFYTASADPLLGLKARLVGADGLVAKSARASELRRAIVAASDGQASALAFDRSLARRKTERLPPDAVAIIGLRLEGVASEGIAEVLGVNEGEVVSRISGLLALLDDPGPGDARPPLVGRELAL